METQTQQTTTTEQSQQLDTRYLDRAMDRMRQSAIDELKTLMRMAHDNLEALEAGRMPWDWNLTSNAHRADTAAQVLKTYSETVQTVRAMLDEQGWEGRRTWMSMSHAGTTVSLAGWAQW